jgi:hypothetical protein
VTQFKIKPDPSRHLFPDELVAFTGDSHRDHRQLTPISPRFHLSCFHCQEQLENNALVHAIAEALRRDQSRTC